MRKRVLAILLVLCMLVGMMPIAAFADVSWNYPTENISTPFGKGDGTKENPFEVSSAQELANLAYLVNEKAIYGTTNYYNQAYYKQTANIDLGNAEWTPIGKGTDVYNTYLEKSFCGHYDGNGFEISNLNITTLDNAATQGQGPSTPTVGLFGIIGDGAEIKNIKVVNANINMSTATGTPDVGIIVGSATSKTGNILIDSCTAYGSVTGNSSDGAYGGIVGHIGGFDASNMANGVVTVNNNINNATISASGAKTAGIVAFVRRATVSQIVSNNTNHGSVTGNACGGIVGFAGSGDAALKLPNGNKNDGTVSGGNIGGRIIPALIDDCTISTNTIAQDYSSLGGTIGANVRFDNDGKDVVYQFGNTEGATINFNVVPVGCVQFTGSVSTPTITHTTDGTLRLILGWTGGVSNKHIVGDKSSQTARSYEIMIEENTSISQLDVYGNVCIINDGYVASHIYGQGVAVQFSEKASKDSTISLDGKTTLMQDSLLKEGTIAFGENGSLSIGDNVTLTISGNGKINGRTVEGGYEYCVVVTGTGKIVSYNGAVTAYKNSIDSETCAPVLFKLEDGTEYCRVYSATPASIAVPEWDAAGYTLLGWYKEDKVFSSDSVAYNDVYTAKRISVITFNANEGSCETSTINVNKGETVGTMPEATRTGYTFNGWFTAETGGEAVTDTTVPVGNTTYYAQWTGNSYKILFDLNSGTGTTPQALEMVYGTAKTLPTADGFSKEGYYFAGWNTQADGEGTTYMTEANNVTATADAEVTLYAVWSEKPVPVLTLRANGAESLSLRGSNTVTFTVEGVPADGNGTLSVVCDNTAYNPTSNGDGTFTVSLPNQTADYTFTATVTYDDDDNYNTASDDCTVSVTRKKSGSSNSGSSSTTSITNDVSVDSTDNGSIKLSDNEAKKGETVTITVTPDDGYELDKLTVTDSKGNEIEVKDNGDGTFTFTMPAGKVEIDAAFKEMTPANPADAEGAIVLTIGSTTTTVDGETVVNDVAPIIREDRTMLPIRFIAETLGAAVGWDEANQLVTITKADTVIKIYIGSAIAYVNDVLVQLDAPAFIENSRTYLPIRFVAENLGATVTWDDTTKTVVIVPNK